MAMKKILYGLLALVMLTPGLVCGPFMAAGKAQAATIQMPDCAGMTIQTIAPESMATKMFGDCANIKLKSVDHTVLKQPDLKITKVFYDPIIVGAGYNFEPPSSSQIRGPPPWQTADADTSSPIYMKTRRLRI